MLTFDHPQNLLAFVNGQLSETETTTILSHLAQCDQCLATVDQLWAEHPVGLASRAVPELDPIAAKRLENRLVKRIHRSDLGGRVVWLGTVGLMNTHLVMFGPMLETYLTLLSLLFSSKPYTKTKKEDVDD